MRIRVLSDLHTEIGTRDIPGVTADLAVLAGNIDRGIKDVLRERQAFPSIPVQCVAGNHEYYDERIGWLREKPREAAAGSNALPNQRNSHDGPRSEIASNADSRTTAIEP
jgi:hypothetical protein